MSSVRVAAQALREALEEVADTRVYTDLGATVDPPGFVVGPPALTWETVCSEPTAATFIVYAVVSHDERAMEALWDLVPLAVEAIENYRDAAVRRASPGMFPTAGTSLPCYEIQIEVSL